jgi:hypothetical protein
LTDIVTALRALSEAALEELGLASVANGHHTLIQHFARICAEAADKLEARETDALPTRCPDCTGLNGAHLPACILARALAVDEDDRCER